MTLIDRRNHHVFEPLLHQAATAALSPGDIASRIRWTVRRQSNCRVLPAEVTGLDLVARRVLLDNGEVPFDFLVLAPGATHAYSGHD